MCTKASSDYEGVQLILLPVFSMGSLIYADGVLAVCAVVYTAMMYGLGILVEISKRKKDVLIVGITVSILMLCFFKYFNILKNIVVKLVGNQWSALKIILPVGISFYSFSGIAYLVDVYRRKYRAERDFLAFFLSMLIFC